MPINLSLTHNIPFITRGIIFRDDFQDTGSWIRGGPGLTARVVTFSTDGDIVTILVTGSGASTAGIVRSLSGSPIRPPYTNIAVRLSSGSNDSTAVVSVVLYSGSLSETSGGLNPTTKFNVFTGSLSGNVSSYVDKIEIGGSAPLPTGSNGSGSTFCDFIMFYKENVELRYINNPAAISLKKRIIEQAPPMREQGIIQVIGAESPRIDIDGIIFSDTIFTAQEYRDKLIDVWQEGNWQFLYTDMINQKYIPENLDITQVPGVVDYYQYRFGLRQWSTISASSGSYNLA